MKETEDSANERLDHPGIIARMDWESGLVEWLDGQKQDNRKYGGRWNDTEGCHVTD